MFTRHVVIAPNTSQAWCGQAVENETLYLLHHIFARLPRFAQHRVKLQRWGFGDEASRKYSYEISTKPSYFYSRVLRSVARMWRTAMSSSLRSEATSGLQFWSSCSIAWTISLAYCTMLSCERAPCCGNKLHWIMNTSVAVSMSNIFQYFQWYDVVAEGHARKNTGKAHTEHEYLSPRTINIEVTEKKVKHDRKKTILRLQNVLRGEKCAAHLVQWSGFTWTNSRHVDHQKRRINPSHAFPMQVPLVQHLKQYHNEHQPTKTPRWTSLQQQYSYRIQNNRGCHI